MILRARGLVRTHRVSQATFDAALARVGVRDLTGLTDLMGSYARLAFHVNAPGVELPQGISATPLSI